MEDYSVHLHDTYNSTHRTEGKRIGSLRTRKLGKKILKKTKTEEKNKKISKVKKHGSGDCCDSVQTNKVSDRDCGRGFRRQKGHQDASVRQPSALSDLLGGSTCMDVDVDSVEADLNAYTRVQQVSLDTDPLIWWKQHVQEFPRLTRMVRQHLDVPATSVSPERLFSSVGLVKSDLRGRLLDNTLIDVMWAKQAP